MAAATMRAVGQAASGAWGESLQLNAQIASVEAILPEKQRQTDQQVNLLCGGKFLGATSDAG